MHLLQHNVGIVSVLYGNCSVLYYIHKEKCPKMDFL